MSRSPGTANSEYVIIGGIQVNLIRKSIRNMYIRIKEPDGEVVVTAPLRARESDIERFVLEHGEWIENARQKALCKPTQEPDRYLTGEAVMLWGEWYILDVDVTNGASYVNLSEDKIIIGVSHRLMKEYDDSFDENYDDVLSEKCRKILYDYYKKELNEVAAHMMDERIGIVGRCPNSWYIRDMKTKWGTCNTRDKRICLNLQLVKYPKHCLEYVITHELVHLYVPNHGRDFYAYMDKFYPDWKRVRKELNP